MMGQRGRSDEDIVLFFKVFPCNKEYNHDFAACFNTHKGDKARRRCLLQHSYGAKMCPDMKNTGKCPRGDSCNMTHSLFEYWLHPMRYRTKMCKDAANCSRPYCFFAHHESELREPTLAPQPLASFANMIGSTGGAESSSSAAASVAVTTPPTPSKHSGALLFRQLSDQQRELLLSLDANSSSFFGLQDSCAASAAAPTAYLQLATGAGSASSSVSDMLPITDIPACTATGLFPAAVAGSSPLAGYYSGEPSPLALDAISSCIAQPMPGVMPNTSPPQTGFLLQQQQQQQGLVNMDPATLAALLQQMDVSGCSGGAQTVAVAPPPPPAGMLTPRSSLGSNLGQVQLVAAGSPQQTYAVAQQQRQQQQQQQPEQQQQLVQATYTPVSMAAPPHQVMFQAPPGLVMGSMSPNQPNMQMQQLQLQQHQQLQLQLQQHQLGQDFTAVTSPVTSPVAVPADAPELSCSSMLPATTLGMAVMPAATSGVTLSPGAFAQQFRKW